VGKTGKCIRNENNIEFVLPVSTDIDLDTLNWLSSGGGVFFLKCDYRDTGSEHILSFDTNGAIPIGESPRPEFSNKLLQGFLSAVSECEDKGLKVCNIILDYDNLFVVDGQLKLILLPLKIQINPSYKKMMKKLIKNIAFPAKAPKHLLSIVKLSQNEADTVNLLYEEIEKSTREQESYENNFVCEISGESETTYLNQEDEEKYENLSSESETTFLSSDTEKLSAQSEGETTFLTENDFLADESGIGETVFFNSEEPKMTVTAFLIRNKTGEQIQISKTFFTIGKICGNVDYSVEDNPCISKHHASLIFEGDSCFLMDNGSTNQTYVEGSAITPYEKVELDNGALFTLGNENFQVFMEAR